MIVPLAALGLLLSAYALWVMRHRSRSYHPLCDLHERISCTRAFTSAYAYTFGVHNAWYGIAFYAIVLAAALLGQGRLVLLLAIAAALRSAHLAYVSYVKQRNFCVVCTAVYIVNALLLIAAWP